MLVSRRSLRYAAGVLLIAGGYYAAVQGGLALLLTGPAGAFWPATGVGIAVLYLGGLRWWPGVLLGDLLTREFALPLWAVLVETAGNMARALLAVVILQRLVGRRAAMDRLEPVGIDLRAALAELPPLLKGYLRLGGFVGDGAVLDTQFNTTDVCILVKTDLITDKYYRHYERKLGGPGPAD